MSTLAPIHYLLGFAALLVWGQSDRKRRGRLLRDGKTKAQEEQQKALPPPDYPFLFLASHEDHYLKAVDEYKQFQAGELLPERYPVQWDVNEDYVILKVNPGRWVEVDDRPYPLTDLIAKQMPDWTTVAWTGAGLAIAVLPGALEFYGIEAGIAAARTANLAFRAASVVKEAMKSTKAGVAELASQLYGTMLPNTTSFGSALQRQLEQQGIQVIIRQGL